MDEPKKNVKVKPEYSVDVIEEQARSTLEGFKKRKDDRITLSIEALIEYTKKVIFLCEEIKKLKDAANHK